MIREPLVYSETVLAPQLIMFKKNYIFFKISCFMVPVAIIAVIQQKGGVGKSTISANLAGELVRFGRSVAVVDLDPQRSLAHWAKLGNGLLSELVEAVNITSPAAFQAKISAATHRAEPGDPRLPSRVA